MVNMEHVICLAVCRNVWMRCVDEIIEKAFQSNAQFQGVVWEAFESVVKNKPAELMGT